MSTAQPDPLLGATIDRFRIERVIGKGSMGIVYYGVEQNSGTPVAIKTMSPEHTHDDELFQRFQREARVGNQIRHQNVAHVYTAGNYGEMPYLVMEYIDGPSLQDMIKQRGMPDCYAAADYIRQAAEGLKTASAKGSIHRDIKPANIMITNRGEIKIVDFGIARNHGGDSLRTAVGVVLGSPFYMSPEQSAAQPLDLRSDIFGLGATFYFLLTTRPPFEGKNLIEIIQKRAKGDLRPINAINPSAPKRIVDVAMKMMATNPNDRYQTYEDLIKALDAAIAAKGEREAPPATEHEQQTMMAAPRPDFQRPQAAQQRPAAPQQQPQRPQQQYQQPYQGDQGAWYESKGAIAAFIGVGLLLLAAAAYLFLFV